MSAARFSTWASHICFNRSPPSLSEAPWSSAGRPSAIGVFCASVHLILMVTLMQIMQLPPGSQDMVQGVVVILVLALAGREAIQTRISRRAGEAP